MLIILLSDNYFLICCTYAFTVFLVMMEHAYQIT